ncbi:unnamed protein product [Thlaspi arvense]|uniref:F-box domain-containing protein n=1 Tax=Thlaspi arvense TaxID=13288 RepID=A0AAU9T618_THLAR|nr:unnamed protein product [Thlaspi arvense]
MERGRKAIRRRRREEICKSHEATRENIPVDIVIEILTRLPPKSLMRFKSVSRLWSSVICSQYFTNRFLKASSPPRIYLWLGFGSKRVLLSSSASPDSDGTVTMSSFVVGQDLTIPAMEGYHVSHVLRGLMCCTNRKSAQIYNTTTRQLVILPDIEESNIIAENHESKRVVYRIGHDPVLDQYKVFCTVSKRGSDRVGGKLVTCMPEHWVLLLGERDVSSRWRKIPSRCPPHHVLRQGLTINGRMHYYLALSLLSSFVLVSFDISSEEICMLQPPINRLPLFISLIECSGRVANLDHLDLEEKGVMKLWVMEDAGKNRWSRKTTLVLQPSDMHMVNMHMVDNMGLRVQGTTRNGEVIFVPENSYGTRTGKIIVQPQNTTLFYVFIYNLEKNHMRKVDIKETSNRYLTRKWDVVGFDDTENLMYL